MNNIGYGVDTTKKVYEYRKDAYERFLSDIASKSILEDYREYETEAKSENPEITQEELLDSFFEEWEDSIGRDGIEQMLCESINERECNGQEKFFYEDYCIYVPADIPVNDAAKAQMLTQEDIQRLLAKYLNPLLEQPVTVEWLDIHLD